MGIEVNTIPRSEVRAGRVRPSQNQCNTPDDVPLMYETSTFDLAVFPKGDLPSGGASCRISPSEMVILYIKMSNYEPRNDSGEYTLYRIGHGGAYQQLGSKMISSDFQEDPNWEYYWSWDYVFFGHFDWEINAAGLYAIEAIYPQGRVLWTFEVTDSDYRPPALQPPQLPLPPAPGQPSPDSGCAVRMWALISAPYRAAYTKYKGGVPPDQGDSAWLCTNGITSESKLIDFLPSEEPPAGQPPAGQPPAGQPPAGQPPAKCPRGQQYTADPSLLGLLRICDAGYRKIEGSNDCECQYDTAGNLTKPGASACAEGDWTCKLESSLGKYFIPAIILFFAVQIIGAFKK